MANRIIPTGQGSDAATDAAISQDIVGTHPSAFVKQKTRREGEFLLHCSKPGKSRSMFRQFGEMLAVMLG
jgi:hypothetical protein